MKNEKPELLQIGVMARRLRVPVKWLRSEAEAGRIPHLKADRVILFNPFIVEKLLLQRASGGANNE